MKFLVGARKEGKAKCCFPHSVAVFIILLFIFLVLLALCLISFYSIQNVVKNVNAYKERLNELNQEIMEFITRFCVLLIVSFSLRVGF